MTDDFDNDNRNENITSGAMTRFARIDERTKAIQEDLHNFRQDVKNSIVNLLERIKEVEIRDNIKFESQDRDHANLVKHLEENYVKKESFSPIQHLVYGFVALIITSVLGALISLVVIVKQ